MADLWCLQCGVKHELNAAVGFDEDGEPACRMHWIAARKSEVVTQPETSKAMETSQQHKCPGYGSRQGTCDALIGPRKELCSKCYGNRSYHQSKDKAPKKVAPKPHRKAAASVATVASISTDCDLTQLRANLVRQLEAVDMVLSLLSK